MYKSLTKCLPELENAQSYRKPGDIDLHPEELPYAAIAEAAYKAPMNEGGIAVLPAEWDDGDE